MPGQFLQKLLSSKKYRVRQDRFYQSDFDKMMLEEEKVQELPEWS